MMFVHPKRIPKHRGAATGLILMGFGALIFLSVIHRYLARIPPKIPVAQAADYDASIPRTSMTPADAADEREIRAIIRGQIADLKRKDFAGAMAYAVLPFPNVTPVMFKGFLQSRYPQNAAPRTVVFLDHAMRFDDGFALQRVKLTGRDGTTVQEFYLMVMTDAGWKIRRFRVRSADDGAYFNPWSDGP